jgi:hypothetical protein
MCAKINIPTPPFVCKIILYYLPQQLSLHKVTVTSQSNDVVQKHTQNIKTLTYFLQTSQMYENWKTHLLTGGEGKNFWQNNDDGQIREDEQQKQEKSLDNVLYPR